MPERGERNLRERNRVAAFLPFGWAYKYIHSAETVCMEYVESPASETPSTLRTPTRLLASWGESRNEVISAPSPPEKKTRDGSANWGAPQMANPLFSRE